MNYYYVTDFEYKTGDILPKGRWASLTKNNINANTLEKSLEEIRLKYNLSLVSRLDCFYAFIRTGDAEGFAMINNKKFIYQVEPCASSFKSKINNYEVYTYLRTIDPIKLLEEEHIHYMEMYWLNEESFINPNTGRVAHAPEIIFDSNVKIINRF